MKSVSRRSVVALGATALLAGIGGRAKAAGSVASGEFRAASFKPSV
jgi:hypothetical protein